MAFVVYMLECSDGSIYTGHTDDLEMRLAQHMSGHFPTCYTSTRRPLTLLWSQVFATRIEALRSERQIKGWTQAKKRALVVGNWTLLTQLARSGGAAPAGRPSTGSGLAE